MGIILNDKDTYITVAKDPSPTIEKKLNEFLKRWLDNDYISKKQFYCLKTTGAPLPKAYGLPKVHKKDIPFRLIVSATNSALYKLASFLNEIIKNSLLLTDYHATNSFELYDRLVGKRLRDSNIILSLDAVSLFTNVPTELALEGISKRWNFITHHTKIPLQEFLAVTKFVLSSTFFKFE